jgi:hypothetical protein
MGSLNVLGGNVFNVLGESTKVLDGSNKVRLQGAPRLIAAARTFEPLRVAFFGEHQVRRGLQCRSREAL